jgi:hypothetical protein
MALALQGVPSGAKSQMQKELVWLKRLRGKPHQKKREDLP